VTATRHALRLSLAAGILAACLPCNAQSALDAGTTLKGTAGGIPKAAGAQTLGARLTVTPAATAFGGFELRNATVVYIAVRGNSLGGLGVTQNYLDAPRARLYNAQGVDIAFDGNGNPGFNGCVAGSSFSGAVVDFYQVTRGQPVNARDACVAASLDAGAYTFSVTPSIPGVTTTATTSAPSSGEILFEVTLNP
jgi:hypothetical protein